MVDAVPLLTFDAAALLERVEVWCRSQNATLVRLPPLSDVEIDRIPTLPNGFPFALPDEWRAQDFQVPASWRAFLRCAGGAYIEVDGERWPVFNLYRPGDCSKAHTGQGPTLCDSWTVEGTTVDDRPFSTTAFLSFATAGLDVEASRWCFRAEPGREPTVWLESNDYECLLGTYTDTDELEWLSEHDDTPTFADFASWLTAVVEVITASTLEDPESNDALVQQIVDRGLRR